MIPFHNPELDAINGLEVDLDSAVVAQVRPHLDTCRDSADFHVAHPPWQSDIAWI